MTEVVTLGCRLNIAEGDAIRRLLAGRDLSVVNGCAVTAEAVRQTAKATRRLKRDRPDAPLVVTGCAGQIEPARFAAMPEVDRVLGNADKLSADAYAPGGERVRVSSILDVMRLAPHLAVAFAEQARAFVEVQSGCDHSCTFCIIPAGRGPSRSVPTARIVERIAALVQAGHREVVLTGVDLTSYADDGRTLGHLVEAILAGVPALPRVRLSSIDPAEVDDRLFDLLAHEPRVMPHVHLSVQAGDDMILKRMKRRHRRADVVALVGRLRARRDILVGADLIAGFPTETEGMAANGVALVAEAGIAFAHVFPYSPRPGTPAARMPQLDRALVKARAAALRETSAAVLGRTLDAAVGRTDAMLVERDGLTGHGESFVRLRLAAPATPGALLPVRAVARDGDVLLVEPR